MLSNSRAGVLSGGVGVIALLCLLLFSHLKQAPYVRSFTAISFVAVLAFFVIGGGTVWDRATSVNLIQNERFSIYEGTLNAISGAPWSGTGSGTFEEVFPFYQPETLQARALRAHNSYLENAMELGIPAAVLLTLAIAIPALRCLLAIWRRGRRAIYPLIAVAATVTTMLHALLDFTLQVPAVAVTFLAILGTGCAQAWNSRR